MLELAAEKSATPQKINAETTQILRHQDHDFFIKLFVKKIITHTDSQKSAGLLSISKKNGPDI